MDDMGDLEEAVDNFVSMVRGGSFLVWEAVVCEEQGLPLTAKQEKALGELLDFTDDEDDEILYLNERPRPSEPWYAILNQIAPHLLIEPYRTFDSHYQMIDEGWRRIVAALRKHGTGLSLPPAAKSHEEAVATDLRHKLWLQWCFNGLGGLGQAEDLTLKNPVQQERIDCFIGHLRKCKESVAYFGLTLDSLMTRVILPEEQQPLFAKLMQEKLGLGSAQEPIASHL